MIERTSALLFFGLVVVFISCSSERDELEVVEVVTGGETWQENILVVSGLSDCYVAVL
jgi:hypothetical protein